MDIRLIKHKKPNWNYSKQGSVDLIFLKVIAYPSSKYSNICYDLGVFESLSEFVQALKIIPGIKMNYILFITDNALNFEGEYQLIKKIDETIIAEDKQNLIISLFKRIS